MQLTVTGIHHLRFIDGRPVRAASAIAPLNGGWLIAQDDATHAGWWGPAGVDRVRLFPPVEGADTFSETAGSKHLKPDLESACTVTSDRGGPAVLLLGSGSLPVRTRAALVAATGDGPLTAGADGLLVATADLAPLYGRLAGALEVPVEQLNLEGACVVGEALRWFQRGNGSQGIVSASVDLPLEALLASVRGGLSPLEVPIGGVRRYALGERGGVGLSITDAVTLPGGLVLVSATAEDTPDAVADGPLLGSVLALVEDAAVVAVAEVPQVEASPWKVEGLAVRGQDSDTVQLLAVVDQDDPARASVVLELDLVLPVE